MREIENALLAYHKRLYHLGMESVAKSTLSEAMNRRNPEIFKDYCLICCEKSCRRRRIAVNLAPCSCAGAVEYFWYTLSRRSLGEDGSRTVLVAKHDLVSQFIRRVDLTVIRWLTKHCVCDIFRCLLFTAANYS